MCHHRFDSELTCDEVWYRLNVLLQSFAVCGAKRYEVRGELTDWGCYLWLRNPEGRSGTPVPLRLWTEEGRSPGCVICGSFLPAGREWWGLLLAAAVSPLDRVASAPHRGGLRCPFELENPLQKSGLPQNAGIFRDTF